MNQQIFNHYSAGTGKQKAWAYHISQNIINGDDTLRQDDYATVGELIEEALIKCVMNEYMERVKRCEVDKVSNEIFKKHVNETLAIIRQALLKRGAKAKRVALLSYVRDPRIIINYRFSFSTLDWAQITFIYLLSERLNLDLEAGDYHIRCCRA